MRLTWEEEGRTIYASDLRVSSRWQSVIGNSLWALWCLKFVLFNFTSHKKSEHTQHCVLLNQTFENIDQPYPCQRWISESARSCRILTRCSWMRARLWSASVSGFWLAIMCHNIAFWLAAVFTPCASLCLEWWLLCDDEDSEADLLSLARSVSPSSPWVWWPPPPWYSSASYIIRLWKKCTVLKLCSLICIILTDRQAKTESLWTDLRRRKIHTDAGKR